MKKNFQFLLIGLYHRRAAFDALFQQFPAGIQDHLFSGSFDHISQFLVNLFSYPGRHTAGHGDHRTFLYDLRKLFQKLLYLPSGHKTARLQIFRGAVSFIQDIDTASCFSLYMHEIMGNAVFIQKRLQIFSIITAHQPGCKHLFSAKVHRPRHIQPFSTGRIMNGLHPHHGTVFDTALHIICFVDRCI